MTWAEIMHQAVSGASDPVATLRAAGKGAILRRAATVHQRDCEPLPAPAEASLPALEPISGLIRLMVRDYPDTVDELLSLLEERDLDIPWGALPDFLASVKRHPKSVRFLGERGTWLASQNPDWERAVKKARTALGKPPDALPVPPQESEAVMAELISLGGTKELEILAGEIKSHLRWSPTFSGLVLEDVRNHFNRAGPKAVFFQQQAGRIAASLNSEAFDLAEKILLQSHAAASHPIVKSWFPVLSVRRRLHHFWDALDS